MIHFIFNVLIFIGCVGAFLYCITTVIEFIRDVYNTPRRLREEHEARIKQQEFWERANKANVPGNPYYDDD